VILVDTSVWIEFLMDPKRVPTARANLADFVTCAPVIQELLQGFADRQSVDLFRDRLLAFPCLSDPLPLDLYIKASRIYREGRRRGFTIRSSADCLIAAIAIENNVPVWHRDRDFTAIARFTPLMIFR
jgi:predicted nucleic acid-binding protein